MRADAERNRERLLDATIELILEVGGEPARDAIAARAELGIGTLYRHFPDRQSLLHAAARHALERCIAAGESALANGTDSFDTLRQYLHASIDNGIGVVNLIHPLLDDPDWPDLSARAATLLTAIVRRNRRDRNVGPDFSERDVAYATIRFGRPLALGLTLAEERAVAHRQLDVYIDGLQREVRFDDRGAVGRRVPTDADEDQ